MAQPALVVAAAAIAAFLGMNHLAGKFAPTEASTPALLPDVAALDNRAEGALTSEHLAQQPTPEADLDPLEVAPPGAAVAPRPSSVSVVDLPLPDDLAVAEGKGLLEVDSQGQHKLYVGNVFVGRGPVRRIPLDPGSHRVVIRLDGVETAKEVEVKPARRLRVQFAEAGP